MIRGYPLGWPWREAGLFPLPVRGPQRHRLPASVVPWLLLPTIRGGAVSDTVEFGGWPRPPRWVWAIAAVAAGAVLAGVVVARGGPHRSAASAPPKSPVAARSPFRGLHTPVTGPADRWPSTAGACGSRASLPQIDVAGRHAAVHGWVLVGGTALRRVTFSGTVSRPLPGLPDHGQLVTKLAAAPGGAYALAARCSSSTGSVRVYRVVAGVAHRLGTTADALLGGPRQVWAVTYGKHTVLTPLNGGPAVILNTDISPVTGTAAGLVVVAYDLRAAQPYTVELINPETGALVRRLADGSALGAAGRVALMSLPGCGAPQAHGRCILEGIGLTTGRPTARFELPAGRTPVPDAVFSPGGAVAAFLLVRARPDPRFTGGSPSPPADVAVLHLHTGGLEMVPGLELPPETRAGLAFDATGGWLLVTVNEGSHGELLSWREGMPGPALVARLPGPLAAAPPLLVAPPSRRNG